MKLLTFLIHFNTFIHLKNSNTSGTQAQDTGTQNTKYFYTFICMSIHIHI